ncbi:AAA family ATPase [Halobellus ruber]|uniref:ORC1-type DNA replication protein n=1 Tax=Halobellus ruber TaxID=2761102 RepID=A0A7J9SPD0_9EURY|nr:ORC1-type DNA replication protein [Halobellus ruber]MBB6647261.1 AAA family ATPase [Halobellus ruber]
MDENTPNDDGDDRASATRSGASLESDAWSSDDGSADAPPSDSDPTDPPDDEPTTSLDAYSDDDRPPADDDGSDADTGTDSGSDDSSRTDPSPEAGPRETTDERTADPPEDPDPSDRDPVTADDIDIEETVGVDIDAPTKSGETGDLGLDEVVLDDDESQGLFDDLLSGEPIFENKEVLRPSYTPHELPHRNEQINQMATILVSALRGETPSNILIYGKTGTGKTASAKFVSQELESTSKKYDVPCEVEYINCEVTDTQYRVLAQLANKFIEKNKEFVGSRVETLEDLRSRARDDVTALADTEFDAVEAVDERIEELEADREGMDPVPMTGWPTDRVYSTFFDAVDYEERVVVIMLDEIDKLVEKSGDDTLYNLSRMNSELVNSRISIMGISNDLKFTDFLDPRVKSSLGEEEIVFPPYDANQLRDILQHRANVAFKPDALTDDVIPLCAAFAAQEHGDARRALDLLRTAGELAERGQADTVEEAHVRKAQDKIELDRVVEVVRTLPTQSKIVLFATILLEKNGVHNVNTGEVFNIYKRLCEEIDADVLTQRRVTDLISELDMLGIVNAVVVSKGRYGRTKEISLSVPIEETEAVLLSDSRLGDIENAQPFVQARFDN